MGASFPKVLPDPARAALRRTRHCDADVAACGVDEDDAHDDHHQGHHEG